MKATDLKKEDLAKLKGKTISINYIYEKYPSKRTLWIKGVIREGYLAINPPNLPANIDFEISEESRKVIKELKIDIPYNIGIFDFEEIQTE